MVGVQSLNGIHSRGVLLLICLSHKYPKGPFDVSPLPLHHRSDKQQLWKQKIIFLFFAFDMLEEYE
jgi:hypothetical protein